MSASQDAPALQAAPRGFTLLEILIALVVLATAGFILSSAIGNISLQTWTLERRAAAHWVAENQLVRVRLANRLNDEAIATGRKSETVILGGRRWQVRQTTIETSHPWLHRVEIEVHALVDGKEVGPLAHLVGFLGRH